MALAIGSIVPVKQPARAESKVSDGVGPRSVPL